MNDAGNDAQHDVHTLGRFSVPAIITYVLLVYFGAMTLGVFCLIWQGKPIEDVMLGVLGGLITFVTSALTGAVGFWLGSSAGARKASAALQQLAGAGAPPPREPVA